MKTTAAQFRKLLPTLTHFARFPKCNRAAIALQDGVKLAEVEGVILDLAGASSLWDEDLCREYAEKFDAKLPPVRALVAPAPASARPAAPRLVGLTKVPATSAVDNAPHPPPMPKLGPPTSDVGRWLEAQRARVTARVNCFQIEVTPALAETWLGFNTGNRKPSRAKIRRFAAAMKSGRWAVNGETIKFSITGRLIDGQSRLMAILEAQTPVVLELRAGLPDLAQQSMDAGELRKGAHVLEMLSETNPAVLAAALKILWTWRRGWLGGFPFGASRVMENGEVAPLLEQNAGLKQSVGWAVTSGERITRLLLTSEAAFLHYLLGTIDVELRDHFFEAIVDGVGLTKQSAVYHLRDRLLSERTGPDSEARKRRRRALVIKAWNAVRHGEKLTALRHADTDPFPEIDGIETPAPQPGANLRHKRAA